jgi:predicted site-specific integrase-resolvase
MADQELLTSEETAARLRVSVDTLRFWRFRGKAPVGIRMGRRVMYLASDVEAFIVDLAADARREGASGEP